jgi:hypothetical protein
MRGSEPRRTSRVRGGDLTIESLSALLNVDWNGIEDRNKRLDELKAAITELQSSLQSFETIRQSAHVKTASYFDRLNQYDDLLQGALSGRTELEGLFSQASQLQAAGDEAHSAETTREQAQLAARKDVERVESVLAAMPAPEPSTQKHVKVSQAHSFLQALDGQLSGLGSSAAARVGRNDHRMRHSA